MEEFESAQSQVLQKVAGGAPLSEVLDAIVLLVEQRGRGLLCSILLFDEETGTLRHGSGPSLPKEFRQTLKGLPIGPTFGSCGAAAFSRKRVIVDDTLTHPNWATGRALAEKHGLRACWSTPIISPDDDLLGTFAIYYREVRSPTEEEEAWIQTATHLAALAIVQERAQESLRRSEARAQQLARLFQERVKELTLLHKAARLLQTGRSIDQGLLADLVALVPAGWRFSEICAARLRWRALRAQTDGFRSTHWHLTAAFGGGDFEGASRGLLEVVYLEEPPQTPAFLEEEKAVIRSLADMIAVTFQRSEAESKLRASESLLRIAGRSARLGGWRLALSERRVVWSDETRALLDVDSGTSVSFEEALAFCELDHREVVKESARKCAVEGVPFDLEIPIVTAAQRRLWARIIGHPERDATGKIVTLQGSLQDIDAHRQLEEQFRQSQKMEAIGLLAGGVAHDFNNMLAVILGYASLATERLTHNHPIRSDLHQIARAAERSAELTQQLLAFSRRQVLKPRVIDLNQILLDLEKLLRRVLTDDVHLSLHTASDLGQMCADPSRIEQVVLNLVVNARDAMPRGGNITIETSNATLDDAYAQVHHGILPGPYVMLAVTDTGEGMDSATRARIFEPFFTTKAQDKGTGLGLSTVWGIVTQSGGHVWVYSEPGSGSSFKIYFPRADRRADPMTEKNSAGVRTWGSETILLVEDEQQVRSVVHTILVRNGYTVVEAQNGGEAFLICERYEGRLDLLLTDVLMPRVSGPELAERIVKLRPELRVLYMSGYTENAVVQHGLLDSSMAFLTKPFTPSELLVAVREVLDRK